MTLDDGNYMLIRWQDYMN